MMFWGEITLGRHVFIELLVRNTLTAKWGLFPRFQIELCALLCVSDMRLVFDGSLAHKDAILALSAVKTKAAFKILIGVALVTHHVAVGSPQGVDI